MSQRKDGRYEKKITVQLPDGTSKRISFYSQESTKRARETDFMRQIMEFTQNIQEEKANGPLFCDYADSWLEGYRGRVSPNTYKTAPARTRAAQERFAGLRIKEITPRQVQSFVAFLASSGLTKKTVTGYLSILNLIFNSAIIDGYLDVNPADLITPQGKESTPRELPAESDIQKVIAAVEQPFGLFVFMAMYTGMRKGELMGLMYQDIDFEEKVIHVKRSVYFEGTKPKQKEPKTKKGIRKIPLLDPVLEYLPVQNIGYVFPGEDKGPMHAREINTLWKHYRKKTGITCTLHQLRHELATLCFENDLSERDAQDILGHADITTTRRVYTHIRDSRQKANYEKLNAAVTDRQKKEKA